MCPGLLFCEGNQFPNKGWASAKLSGFQGPALLWPLIPHPQRVSVLLPAPSGPRFRDSDELTPHTLATIQHF